MYVARCMLNSNTERGTGLLQGSCVAQCMVRAPTAKVLALGFESQWLPFYFFSQFVSVLIYHQLLYHQSYHQLVINIVTN